MLPHILDICEELGRVRGSLGCRVVGRRWELCRVVWILHRVGGGGVGVAVGSVATAAGWL